MIQRYNPEFWVCLHFDEWTIMFDEMQRICAVLKLLPIYGILMAELCKTINGSYGKIVYL